MNPHIGRQVASGILIENGVVGCKRLRDTDKRNHFRAGAADYFRHNQGKYAKLGYL